MLSFSCTDPSAWAAAAATYGERVRDVGGDRLVELDTFVASDLPREIAARETNGGGLAFLKKEELVKVVDWKLRRGKWRPRLLGFASSLPEEAVRSASEKAFSSLPDNLETAVRELTALKGVGPATASALLAAHSPHIAPFMSDEALVAAVGEPKEYTLKKYMAYARRMQDKAEELKRASEKDENNRLTVWDMERALWSSARETSAKQKEKKKRGKEAQGEVRRVRQKEFA